jgi:hypothetical protein
VPPAGMVPKGKPMAVPRSQAGQERRHSLRVMCALFILFIVAVLRPS